MTAERRVPQGATLDEIGALLDIWCGEPFVYRAEPAEVGALNWLGSRYLIAEQLYGAMDHETGDIWVDPVEVGSALSADGVDRVPDMDEGTTLARIVWCIGPLEGE